jgi:hypothetical protein
MSVVNGTIPIPEELLRDISQQAVREGVPTEQWVFNALDERIRVQRQTEEFFRLRAVGASGKTLGELLDKAPDGAPDPGDEFDDSIHQRRPRNNPS